MIDGNDLATLFALRELQSHIKESHKPLVFWIGAGASAWCGYPLWGHLAEEIHSAYIKTVGNYDREEARSFLEVQNYPGVFQKCRDANTQLFYTLLAKHLKGRPTKPVYRRFIETLQSISPINIITTNVDEALENNLPQITTLQRTDLERCLSLLQSRESFVSKIHGSASSIMSTVFTTEDYNALVNDRHYLTLMEYIFSQATLVFVGYGLGDEYIINLLDKVHGAKFIFGDGPHYAITPSTKSTLPASIRQIRYIPDPHKDHRTPIQVLSEIKELRANDSVSSLDINKTLSPRSAHLISDIYPPGTWKTSQTALASGPDRKIEIHKGHGLITSEMPFNQSTAMHDLTVGLLCFDIVYAPLPTYMRINQLLSTELFLVLVSSGCIKFVDWAEQLVMVYPERDALTGGQLKSMSVVEDRLQRIRQAVEQELAPLITTGESVDTIFNTLIDNVEFIDQSKEPLIPELTRGLLMRPSIRHMLGVSGGIMPTDIPRWMRFPVLRLANVAKIGAACQLLDIASTKLDFGFAKLAEPAFAAVTGAEFADSVASYVISGEFDSDLNSLLSNSPEFFKAVIDFRDTQEGVNLREQVLYNLSINEGGDVAASINAGLRKLIPTHILGQSRKKFAGLYTGSVNERQRLTSLWCDTEFNNTALFKWRARSAAELKMYCEQMRVGKTSRCPCGSGESFRFCCEEVLSHLS